MLRRIVRMGLVACIAFGVALPAHAEDRTVEDLYTGSTFINWQGTYVNAFGGWIAFELFPGETSVSAAVNDVSGRPVAAVLTQFPGFTGEYELFCGSGDLTVTWENEEPIQTAYLNVVLGNGPAGCENSLPLRGTVTVTIA